MGKAADSDQDLDEKRKRHNEVERLYRERNRELLREKSRRRYEAHKAQVRTYQKEYDRRPEAIALRKQRLARRHRVSEAEGQRLRMPEHRFESLNCGPKGEVVCLNCFWKGKRLGTHCRVCSVRPQSADQYAAQYGFEGESLISRELRENIARVRTGKRLKPLHHRRKVTDSKILKVAALGLSIKESGKLAGISAMGFYRRAEKLGWKFTEFREKQRLTTKYVAELSSWIKAQGTVPTIEQIADRQYQECASGGAVAREFIKFFPHLEAQLRQSPEMIQQLRAAKDTKAIFTLTARVLKRTRVRGAGLAVKESRGHRHGYRTPDTERRIRLAAALKVLDFSAYRMAPLLYPKQRDRNLAYEATLRFQKRNISAISEKAKLMDAATAARVRKAGLQ